VIVSGIAAFLFFWRVLTYHQPIVDGCRQFRQGGHLKQLEHAGRETVAVYRPDLEAVDLEQPADGEITKVRTSARRSSPTVSKTSRAPSVTRDA
jgi:hypothetical protein